MASTSPWDPEGRIVSSDPALVPDAETPRSILDRLPEKCEHRVTLVPLMEQHAADLYSHLGGPQNQGLYKYLPTGPYNDLESFTAFVKSLIETPLFFPFAIFSLDAKRLTNQIPPQDPSNIPRTPIAIIGLLNIVPAHRTIEIGCVLFGPALQRTTAASCAVYLLMKHCFEDLGYRRVEWKANNLNEPSKKAALRYGFIFEGVFRNHMVIKGRNRDTAWYSVTDDEWEGGVKAALEQWLDKGNFDDKGKQMKKLEEIRYSLKGNPALRRA